jgi:hypothetical protein
MAKKRKIIRQMMAAAMNMVRMTEMRYLPSSQPAAAKKVGKMKKGGEKKQQKRPQ